jgi:outer membrane protein assembly factor BamB
MMKKTLPLLLATTLLSGCWDFWKDKKEPLEGTREVVFLNQEALRADASTPATSIVLKKASARQNWATASAEPAHNPDPATLPQNLRKLWSSPIDTSSNGKLLSSPVIAEGLVFAGGSAGEVSAFRITDGERLWTTQTLDETRDHQPFGGGVSWDAGRLYVTTAAAEVLCLNTKDGSIVWRRALVAPARSAPTVDKGRLYIATINNQLNALSATDGQPLWSHVGMMESAGLLGGASPAVAGNTVVVAYTSGEVFALTADNGYPLWVESLNSPGAVDSLSSLAHIKARPVIHNGAAYLISHANRMSAIDLRTGKFLWNRQIGGVRTPALSGDFLFMLSNDNHLVCCENRTGKVIWTKQLPHKDGDTQAVLWAGPILVNNTLVITGSNGKILFCNVQSGEILKDMDAGSPLLLSPVTAQETLVVLSDQGDLIAFGS